MNDRAGASQGAPTVRSVLLVDDNGDLRTSVSQLLESEGYEVVTAANGRQALETLDLHGRPCLILLDLMMPVMDGWEFLKAMRANARMSDIPVVILSASAFRTESRSIGVAGVLAKPIQPDLLFDLLRQHCGGRPGGENSLAPFAD